MNNVPAIQDVSYDGIARSYLANVYAQPILTAEEEHDLAVRYRDQNDLDAAQRLVLSHLRYVVHVARGFRGYGLPVRDLVQEGSVGLMKAVQRFDPDRNIRLVTFAAYWIKAEIYDYVVKNWKIVRVATTKAQRKLFFKIRKYRPSLESMTEKDIQEAALELDMSADEIREMDTRMNGTYESFDALTDDGDDVRYLPPSAYLADSANTPQQEFDEAQEKAELRAHIESVLSNLDSRSRDIIVRRWLDEDSKATLNELAAEYGISAERVRQIETNALAKVRRLFEAAEIDPSTYAPA